MDHDFWHTRWRHNRIAFHEGMPNALLTRHIHRLGLHPGDRVFVPLCGKAHDLDWLLAQGFRVVGIELNRTAVEAAVERLGGAPEATTRGGLAHYAMDSVDLFVGDFFALTPETLGPVDAIYDRAALVALPEPMRNDYVGHLTTLTNTAPQLLISYDYDQTQTDGPPFSVPAAALHSLYDTHYHLNHVDRTEISGPLANRCSGSEDAWHLTPR